MSAAQRGTRAAPEQAPGGAAGGVLPVVEIFGPTLQGEGRSIGRKTMFVRLAGCDWSCSWCDTPYAWRAGAMAPVRRMTGGEVVDGLASASRTCRHVTLSGGNPAIHDCGALLRLLHATGYRVHVETQGTLHPPWLADADTVTVSPKPPSSGMPAAWDDLAATLAVAARPELKVVVFDDDDYAYARAVHARHPEVPFEAQVGNRVGEDGPGALLGRLRWLAAKVLADPAMDGARVLPQLHVLIWGNRPGV